VAVLWPITVANTSTTVLRPCGTSGRCERCCAYRVGSVGYPSAQTCGSPVMRYAEMLCRTPICTMPIEYLTACRQASLSQRDALRSPDSLTRLRKHCVSPIHHVC
jgi:hypothetical protein